MIYVIAEVGKLIVRDTNKNEIAYCVDTDLYDISTWDAPRKCEFCGNMIQVRAVCGLKKTLGQFGVECMQCVDNKSRKKAGEEFK